MGGEALSEVIDIVSSTRDANLRKAVDFFSNGKVVCQSFQVAKNLLKNAGCRNIVTLDGTELKSGSITCGKHSGLAQMTLGKEHIERSIVQL